MASMFPLPMMMTAGQTGDEGKWEGSTGSLRDLAKRSGFKTVALQFSETLNREQVKTLQDAGLFVIAWDEASRVTKAWFDDLDFDGWMPQVESFEQYDSARKSFQDGIGAGLANAIVTTYWGLYAVDAQGRPKDPLARDRWLALKTLGAQKCFVECYKADGFPHNNLDRMLNQGVVYGIPRADLFPVCGTWQSEMPSDYPGLENVGRNFGCYIGDPMTDAQWAAWGAVNPVKLVYYWRLRAGTAVMHEERAVTYPDKTTGYQLMLDWMEGNRDKIAAAKSTVFEYVRLPEH